MNGKIINLKDVPDVAFSEEMVGKGVAVIPEGNEIYSPVEGKITTVFITGHAIGITTKEGIDLLMHIGMDTVNLKGEGFAIKVKDGKHIKKGDLLLVVDFAAVPYEDFSVGILGKGVAIIPEENEVCAPVSGIITSLFPTLHAIGITTKEGIEVLIHIGINTVNLRGMCFDAKVCEKAKVKTGNLLLTANLNKIQKLGYDIM